MDKTQPFAPMKPLEPMKEFHAAWWPAEFGDPSSSGSADGLRYAYFSVQRRLLIERGDKRVTYDTGAHHFRGVLQSSKPAGTLSFQSQHGRVDVDSLKTV